MPNHRYIAIEYIQQSHLLGRLENTIAHRASAIWNMETNMEGNTWVTNDFHLPKEFLVSYKTRRFIRSHDFAYPEK
jgi:hypothetical protein